MEKSKIGKVFISPAWHLMYEPFELTTVTRGGKSELAYKCYYHELVDRQIKSSCLFYIPVLDLSHGFIETTKDTYNVLYGK